MQGPVQDINRPIAADDLFRRQLMPPGQGLAELALRGVRVLAAPVKASLQGAANGLAQPNGMMLTEKSISSSGLIFLPAQALRRSPP
jgi:hypothetical protein